MTHVTCRLTAKNRHQLRKPTLGNRVWATLAVANVARRAARTTVKWKILGSQLGSRPCSNFANRLVVRLDEPPHYLRFGELNFFTDSVYLFQKIQPLLTPVFHAPSSLHPTPIQSPSMTAPTRLLAVRGVYADALTHVRPVFCQVAYGGRMFMFAMPDS